jgi:hypothetical protein
MQRKKNKSVCSSRSRSPACPPWCAEGEKEEKQRRGSRRTGERKNRGREKPKYPTTEIKVLTRDPSELRIKHVNTKTVAFQRDLRIRGLRSTIKATVQKLKIFVNSGASF